jgi:hypothetical protein
MWPNISRFLSFFFFKDTNQYFLCEWTVKKPVLPTHMAFLLRIKQALVCMASLDTPEITGIYMNLFSPYIFIRQYIDHSHTVHSIIWIQICK